MGEWFDLPRMDMDNRGKRMKIAVTGYRGFIGKHLMEQLDNPNDEIIVVDDILGKIPKADAIIHLAAQPSVPYSVDHPYETHRTNVDGTINILDACRKYKAKLVFPSSSQASSDALNPYGLQKHHCEELIRLYGKLYNVHYCILRLYNVFGAGEHGVIGAFQKAAKAGKPLEIWGGSQRRDFVHVDTVVDNLINGIKEEGTFEIGSGKTWSVQEIADMISKDQILMPLQAGQPMETRCPTPIETIDVKEYIDGTR